MMRILIVNVCVLLMAIGLIQAQGQSGSMPIGRQGITCNIPENTASATSSCFLKSHSGGVLRLMKEHFQYSMDYLLTSKQYGSQYVQRPGMAKLLAEESDRHWEEGMDVLKKYLQRGGDIAGADTNFKGRFASGTPQLAMTGEHINTKYLEYLQVMLENSKKLAKGMSLLYHSGGKSFDNGGDAELAHYFGDKMEKEVENIRELTGHITTLGKMNHLGVALSTFDSHL